MRFYRTDTKVILNSIYDLKKEFPTTSFGKVITAESLEGYPVKILEREMPPSYNQFTQTIVLGEPTYVSETDTYVQSYTVVSLPEIEKEAKLEEYRSYKLSQLAADRYNEETKGITLNGSTIKTDRESQATINGAVTAVTRNPEMIIDWKGDGGIWITIDRDTVLAIADAVTSHVQACFSRERVLSDQVRAATSVDELDTIVWSMD